MAGWTHAALIAGAAIGAYLLGSVNFSILLARLLRKPDPRTVGSGNAGATNLARVAGYPWAVVVLLLDLGRAFGVVYGAVLLGLGELSPALTLPLLLGNLYPLYHRFRGGKGVAAAVGAMLAIEPLAMLCGGGVFFAGAAVTRRVSVGSLAMAASYPAWTWLFGGPRTELVTAATIGGLVIFTHRLNIARLARGEEPRIGARATRTGPEERP